MPFKNKKLQGHIKAIVDKTNLSAISGLKWVIKMNQIIFKSLVMGLQPFFLTLQLFSATNMPWKRFYWRLLWQLLSVVLKLWSILAFEGGNWLQKLLHKRIARWVASIQYLELQILICLTWYWFLLYLNLDSTYQKLSYCDRCYHDKLLI